MRDVVTAARAGVEKRWLLHTTNKPLVTGHRFTVDLPADPARQQTGGRLDAYVLLPEGARLNAIGGPGFEFWVDGKNDENGTLGAVIARRGQPVEPGNWRMEVMPPVRRIADEFLVALVPRAHLSGAVPRIRTRPRTWRGDCRHRRHPSLVVRIGQRECQTGNSVGKSDRSCQPARQRGRQFGP